MPENAASPTLDGLFRRILARRPDGLALVDPPDKMRVNGLPPRQLTFREADRAIDALATHFVESGLPPGSILAVQLPNTIEFVLTLLAAHRAGLVAALLPLLWRHADLSAALNRIGARAIVGCSRIDGVSHADLAMNAAVETFSVRHVCGFGPDLPEGMASLDQVIAEERAGSSLAIPDARRAAIVTFDVTAQGMLAVPRTHLNLIAGGLAVYLESAIPQGAVIVAAQTLPSFAGVAAALTGWLLSGGTLALHHPFDHDVLMRQIADLRCDTLIAPSALTRRLSEDSVPRELPTLRHAIALWRAPEQVASSPAWSAPGVRVTDVYLFGEAGLFAAVRSEDGLPAAIQPGPYGAPRADPQSPVAGDIVITAEGTLGLRGSMVPIPAYVASRNDDARRVGTAVIDYVDTGYAARLDRNGGAICITAPPPAIMAVGGYRFLADDLQSWARQLGQGAMLTAVPDRLMNCRLAGRASDNRRARLAFAELGLNPLMVEAFRDQPAPE